MTQLFHCGACGFLSTRGSEFRRLDGVLLDRACAADYEARRQPVTRWVEEAKRKAESV